MYVLPTEKGKLCFFFYPKTGTRALERAIRDRSPHYRKSVKGRHGVDCALAEQIKNEGGIVAAVARNPAHMIASWWAYSYVKKQSEQPPFYKYHRLFLVQGRNPWIPPGGPLFYYSDLVTHWMKYERGLESEANRILKLVDIEPLTLPVIGKADKKYRPWDEYYTPEMLEETRKVLAHDYAIWESL